MDRIMQMSELDEESIIHDEVETYYDSIEEENKPGESTSDEDSFESYGAEHQEMKREHRERYWKNKSFKAYKEKKIIVNGKEIPFTWFAVCRIPGKFICIEMKQKDKLTPQEVLRAKRAKRKYGTHNYIYTYAKAKYGIYTYAKAKYGKNNSRAHKAHADKHEENFFVDEND